MNATLDDGPAIQLVKLTKQYGQKTAVDDLSLSVPRGSTFGLLGPNGAGKTTTIKMLVGILSPTRGGAIVSGRHILAEPLAVKQCVGYVPESHHIDRWMRVGEAIAFCRSFYETWNETGCRQLLDLFGLDENQRIKSLSKGMLVKLSLLLAVAHDPAVLVLDEPMAGLDPLAREEFLDGVLRSICEREQTVLFSTHSLDDVQRLADTVGILYEGRLLVHRKIDELLATTKRIRATLTNGQPPAEVPANIVWQRVQGREWLMTVSDFTPETVHRISAVPGVAHVEVIDLGLEDLFKDFIRGQRVAS
jgi:ABC-2 type transport system ATP-binding protein